MDIKNALIPIYDPSMAEDRYLYNKQEKTLLNHAADSLDLVTPQWQYHSDGATKGAYRSSLDSNFMISGLIQNTTGIFKGSVTDFDAKINWKNTANKALIDFNLALGEGFEKSNFSKLELENIGLNLKNMPNLGENIDKSSAFNIFLYQNIDKYLDVDYAIKDTLNPGNYKKGDEEQDNQIKEFVKSQLMAHWESSADSMKFVKNLTKDINLNSAKIEETKTSSTTTEVQNESKTDEKSPRKAIEGKSRNNSIYDTSSQIYSDAFSKFINSQNLENSSMTTLLKKYKKSNIKV
ncbi:hypothetical protein [Campylobacter fetus]|uniref:hypothetical protein n=1 Tax=Campylobacter fetus TaxID=196 RepID=UPI00073AC377|nr:hypothetical protein [Campylobacter fetus]ALV64337.1 hypothetical protein CFTSP3_0353 [Campylobacter fetus subsp. testudinum Sp3]AVK80623.1 hypothetical protein C6B32_01825 [Campylobacter fetus subsp. testudinum]EAK0830247.1 hypothetical protein [Campylobacter fetus]MPB72759.1 hypothetical protein [Campylobacter fetus]MPB76842.1 hypothetical protein [Campylobacter fetus]